MAEKTAKLAYILGSIFGDGHFDKKNNRIQFGSCDREFIYIVTHFTLEVFNIKLKINKYKRSRRNPNHRDYFYFASRRLYRLICNLGITDFDVIPEFVKLSGDKVKAAFIKGFFDAEGNVDIHIIKKRNETQRHIRCFNNNVKLLSQIKDILSEFRIESSIQRGKGINYYICIWNYRSLLNFNQHIGFNILRKRYLLEKAIKSYKQLQTRWSIENYKVVMELRKTGFGATRIKRYIRGNIPKPTIESWIYRKTINGGA